MDMTSLTTIDGIQTLIAMMRQSGVREVAVTKPGQALRVVLKEGAPAPVRQNDTVGAPAFGRLRLTGDGITLPRIGDDVGKGTILGFMDTGAFLMPIHATADAKILRCHAADGDILGFGQPVFGLEA